MINLQFLDALNVDEFVDQISRINYNETIEILKNIIDHAPFISPIAYKLIQESVYMKENIKPDIENILKEKTDDADVNLSRCIYATYLGAKTNLSDKIKRDSSFFEDVTIECLEIAKFENKIENFYCHSILKELRFSKKECFAKLKTLPFDTIIDVISKDQSIFNISILILMCRFYGFLELLEPKISLFKMKNQIIASIFINFFSDDSVYSTSCSKEAENEKEILKRLLTHETLDYCLKVVNKKYLGLLLGITYSGVSLPSITQSEFEEMKFETKAQFFSAFLKLTSPSVSHFFSYLEFYKNQFKLDENEKEIFLNQLKEFHKENKEYLEIVLDKLNRFGLINHL